MKSLLRRLLTEKAGVTALEFAIVGPIFFMLIIFILEAALFFWAQGVMQMAAAQTARCTAIGSSACPNPQAYVVSLLDTWGISGIVPSFSVIVLINDPCGAMAGHFSKVTLVSAGSNSAWVIAPLFGTVLTTSACYPSGT